MALRGAQRHHKTEHEDITTWIIFLLDVLTAQAEAARSLIERHEPEQTLSERQLEVLRLFDGRDILAPKDMMDLLKGRTPMATIKQAIGRLVKLGLIKRIGLGRATRYRKA